MAHLPPFIYLLLLTVPLRIQTEQSTHGTMLSARLRRSSLLSHAGKVSCLSDLAVTLSALPAAWHYPYYIQQAICICLMHKMPCVLHNIVIDNACSDMHLNFVQAASKTSLQISIARDSVLAHKSTYVLLIVNWSVFTI